MIALTFQRDILCLMQPHLQEDTIVSQAQNKSGSRPDFRQIAGLPLRDALLRLIANPQVLLHRPSVRPIW